jgi:hypothetical protein
MVSGNSTIPTRGISTFGIGLPKIIFRVGYTAEHRFYPGLIYQKLAQSRRTTPQKNYSNMSQKEADFLRLPSANHMF